MAVAVHLKNVQFSYPRSAPLLEISELNIPQGERIFIQGASGSGKTTFLGLLTGILTPQSGSVEVLGQELTQLSSGRRDRFRGLEIGYIFQMFNLLPHLTVEENIALPCQIFPQKRKRLDGSVREEIERLASVLELTEHLKKSPLRLSVGQQQRVAVARALMGKPGLIVADEPTSSLDSDRRNEFLRLLFEQVSASNATLIFVSHDSLLADRFTRRLSMSNLAHGGRS